jgi:D-beta-D-heptose 7-phosphate kinase/D-beta-D-heptose 1-phosphate adenosyltransferase
MRVIARNQQVLRIDREITASVPCQVEAEAMAYMAACLPRVDGVICSDYRKGFLSQALLQKLCAAAKATGKLVILDPKSRDFSLYRGVDIITPNLKEAEEAAGLPRHEEATLERIAEVLLQQSEARAVVITRGKDGISLFERGTPQVHLPAQAREVFDATGAGDTAIGVLSMAVFGGLPLIEAAQLANVAAGIVVGKVGTAVVSTEELLAAVQWSGRDGRQKIYTRETLASIVHGRRQQGDRAVFTNGCFDLLHAGHIQYLQQARELGTFLIVGLNDDQSVRALKGAARPLMAQAERARLLAALQCVDYVTIFAELTPLALIQALKPDVLVKGGDYTLDTVVGREVVESYGGRVELVPFVDGVSTTGIISNILQRYG